MNGCRWQEKSFSVAVTKAHRIKCKCGEDITGNVYRYNGETVCKKCFNSKPSVKSTGLGFNSSKDKLWEFTEYWGGKQIEIRTKGQFDKFCKEKGLTWRDVKQSFRQPSEYKKNNVEFPHKEVSEIMLQTAKEKGLIDKLKLKRR